jgi:hypothetical protein
MCSIRILLLALLFLPTALTAQVRLTEAEERERALGSVRDRGHSGAALAILTQEQRSRSPAVLDAFADSLVAIAIAASRARDPAATKVASAARVALAQSARPERGRPYPHAFEALVHIYDSTTIHGGTLGLLAKHPDEGRVVEFMAGVVTSANTTSAITAMRHLANDLGPGGIARLRRIWEAGEVVDPRARCALAGIAEHFEWPSGGVAGRSEAVEIECMAGSE